MLRVDAIQVLESDARLHCRWQVGPPGFDATGVGCRPAGEEGVHGAAEPRAGELVGARLVSVELHPVQAGYLGYGCLCPLLRLEVCNTALVGLRVGATERDPQLHELPVVDGPPPELVVAVGVPVDVCDP